MFNINSFVVTIELTQPPQYNVQAEGKGNFTYTGLTGTTQPYGTKIPVQVKMHKKITEAQAKMFTPGRMIQVIGFLDAVENNTLIVTGKEFDIQGLSKEARETQKNNRNNFNGNQQGGFRPQQPGFQPQQQPVATQSQGQQFGSPWPQGQQ
jgi:hypothetical protein